jgi:hypothetical protein
VPAGLQRHAHVRAEGELVDDPEVLGVAGRGPQELLGHLVADLGCAAPDDLHRGVRAVRVGRVALLELADQLVLRRVGVHRGHPTDRGAFGDVDEAQIGEERDAALGEAHEDLRVVPEIRSQERADVGEELHGVDPGRDRLLTCLARRDVERQAHHAGDRPVRPEQR